MPFWVIGGEYTDTRFAVGAGGRPETRLGPFARYDEAKAEWARRAQGALDEIALAVHRRRTHAA